MIGCAEKLFIFIFYFYSVEKLKTAIFVVGEIGGNEIDAITISIISKKKKSFLFSLQNELLWLLIPNSLLLFHRVIGYGDTQVVVTKIFLIGYLPIYLIAQYTNNSSAYDNIWRVSFYL